jgi:predicted ArsR family transcriptional regulator
VTRVINVCKDATPNVSEPPDVEEVASLLADDCARHILIEANEEECSAQELSEVIGTSEPTVYRRLEELQEHDLIVEEIQPVPDGKNYKTYQTNLNGVELELEDDGFVVTVSRREPMSDRFTRIIEEI